MKKNVVPLVIISLLLLTSFIAIHPAQASPDAEPRQPTAIAVDANWLYASVWYTNNNDISYCMLNKMSKSGTVVANLQLDTTDNVQSLVIANGAIFAVCRGSIIEVDIATWTVIEQWSYDDFGSAGFYSYHDAQAVGNYVYVLGSDEDPETYDEHLALWRVDLTDIENPVILRLIISDATISNTAFFTIMNNVAYVLLDEGSIAVSIVVSYFPTDYEDIVVTDTTDLDPESNFQPQSIVNDGTYLYVADLSSGYIYKLDTDFAIVDRSDTSSQPGYANYGWYYVRTMSYYNGNLYLADCNPIVGEVFRLSTTDMDTSATVVLSDVTFPEGENNYNALFLCLDGTSIYVALQFTPMIEKLSISPFEFTGNFTSVGTGISPPSPTPAPTSSSRSGQGSFHVSGSSPTPLPTLGLGHANTPQPSQSKFPFVSFQTFIIGIIIAVAIAGSIIFVKRR